MKVEERKESPPPTDTGPPPPLKNVNDPPWSPPPLPKAIHFLNVFLLLLPFLYSVCQFHTFAPYKLSSHQFLVFFPLLSFSCIIAYIATYKRIFTAWYNPPPANEAIEQLIAVAASGAILQKSKPKLNNMKLTEHQPLWQSIQGFQLDAPNAAITFSVKLANKQGWSPEFTERVIEEYKKFLFLCCISPTGASPSAIVDEAWHLHLTYTESYWVDLCKNILGKDIHHHPSKGGNEEDHKHRDWYQQTLQLYRSAFGATPPKDIWLPKPEYATPIYEPKQPVPGDQLIFIIMLLTLPFLINMYQHRVFSPFSLKGADFIVFFPMLTVSCIVCFLIIEVGRRRQLTRLVTDQFPADATVFETAHFFTGKHGSLQTAILDLVRRHLLETTADHTFILHRHRYLPQEDEQNPLIAGFLSEHRPTVTYVDIESDWYRDELITHPGLQRIYTLTKKKTSFFNRYHLMLIPFIIGFIGCVQGVANDKPLGILFFELVGGTILFFIVNGYTARRAVVFNTVKKMVQEYTNVHAPQYDSIVSKFATGGHVLRFISQGAMLAMIFTPHGPVNHTAYLNNGSGSGSCGSSGCGGSSCSSGCGGCGGGGD